MKLFYVTKGRKATTDLMLANAIIDCWIEAPDSKADRVRKLCIKLKGAVLDIEHASAALGISNAVYFKKIVVSEGGQSAGNGRIIMPGSDTRQLSFW